MPNDERPRRPNPRPGDRKPARASRPDRARSPHPDRRERHQRPAGARSAAVEPQLPDDVDPRDLDRAARAGLASLPKSLADKVAAHLVAAGRALDDDPEVAHAHATYARNLAPRLAVVREAVAVTAYRSGDYAAALNEFRALRRMTGDASFLPVMADCERGLGRPERAIALAREAEAAKLAAADRVELAIVASGARRDRGEFDAAVAVLRPLMVTKVVRSWTPRLWYAYADALLDAGRREEAREWFERAADVDENEETDAAERLAEFDRP